MSNLAYKFSIYPYDPNEPTEQHTLEKNQTSEELYRQQIPHDLGMLAMAAVTGIAGPEHHETQSLLPSIEQRKKLGSVPVSTLIAMDRPSFMNSLEIEQAATIDEQAVLGYASQRTYDLAA